MFIRQKQNASGKISVQIIDTSGTKDRLVKTIGSSSDPAIVEELMNQARQWLANYTGQQSLSFGFAEDEHFFENLKKGLNKVLLVGPSLILGKIYDEIGFSKVGDEMLKHLVISRLVFPLSKLKTCEYLLRYQNLEVHVDQIYRYLDKIQSSFMQDLQQISYNHTLKLLGGRLSVVFYDVTTLYFEASDEDDLRKTGFSKEGKHQHPQIVLGLLVSTNGYPLSFEMFEGSQFEGHTMIPVLEAFKHTFNIDKLIVVADAGLMSKKNLEYLSERGYEFIIGARLKNESKFVKDKVLALKLNDGQSALLDYPGGHRLVVTQSNSRARKDRRNREKGLQKIEQKLKSGKLSKQHINNRGYNKYLKLQGEVSITIDYEKFRADQQWDGLKGYLTNSKLSKEEVVAEYNELWQIEKAFRISKTDLRVRPIYHRLPKRIEAHLIVAFCSYKVYKELDRQLKAQKSAISPQSAIELMKTIYQINVLLPKSKNTQSVIFTEGQTQKQLMKMFGFQAD